MAVFTATSDISKTPKLANTNTRTHTHSITVHAF